MKKRLLLSLALALGTLSTFAYTEGDYVYTPSAKLKITGANLVQNGSFTAQTTSWVGQDGASAVSADNWSIGEALGPNGVNVLQSNNGGDGLDNYAYQSISLAAGNTYVVSLQIKGGAITGTSTTSGQANYVDAYVNTTGAVDKTGARQIFDAGNNVIGTDWTTISDTIVSNSDEYLVIGLGRLDAGTQFTNVEVHVASNVYDTRIAEKQIAYDKKILAIPEFANDRDELEGMVATLEEGLKTGDLSALGLNVDDVSGMTDFMNQLKALETQFLDANSYDLVSGGVITGPGLWVNKLQRGSGTYGDWYIEGGRWMHTANAEDVRDDMPGSYAIPANKIEIQKTLPAGKYFFQIDAYGYTNTGRKVGSSYYDPDYNTPVTNQLYIGNDSLPADTLDARNWQTYFIMADVPAGADNTVKNLIAGCKHSAQAKGGNFYYRNPVLRLVSPTAKDDITKFDEDNKKAVQLNSAKVMIDSASVVVAKPEYYWGKSTLQSAIDAETNLYNTLNSTESTEKLNVLDESGNPIVDDNGNYTTKTVADSLTQVMRDMRTAIQAYYTNNRPLTNLVAEVAAAQKTYDDPDNARASQATKAAFKTELDNANALINTFKAQTDSLPGDVDKSNAQIEALQTASENFTASTASYANPSEISINNALMTSGPSNGWDTTGSQTDNGRWKAASNANFEGGKMWNVSRGYTAYSKNNAKQKVTLTHAGAYEFITQYYGYNRNGGRDGDVTTDHHNYFFAKLDASADSIAAISIHTNRGNVVGDWDQRAIDTLGYGGQVPEYFVITYNKADNTPEVVEFGIDAMQNSGSNLYAFGGNHIRYYGDYNQYKSDVLSTLQAEIAKAQATLNANASISDSVQYKAVGNAILAAQSAIDGTTLAYPISSNVRAPFLMTYVGYVAPEVEAAKTRATTATPDDKKAALETKALLQLQRAEKAFEPISTGIQGVKVNDADAVKSSVKGVYNIAGQKVAEKAENLPAGLYIVNGKKVLVK